MRPIAASVKQVTAQELRKYMDDPRNTEAAFRALMGMVSYIAVLLEDARDRGTL